MMRAMSLRAKLVSSLAALVAVGLVAFGFATYARYSADEYSRLDAQLHSAVPAVSHALTDAVGLDGGPHHDGGGGPSPDGQAVSVTGYSGLRTVYAELRAPSGVVVARLAPDGQPKLPTGAVATNRVFTVGSATGSGAWRVVTADADGAAASGYQVLLGTPTKPVTDALNALLLIEMIGGLVLLAVLVGGSWVVVRHGLRPLEDMSRTAQAINAGDLSLRVSPADGRSEVGQLGLALNSMLDGIEESFRVRDDTERRLRQFLSDASHELRTPLTSIQGFAELFRLGQRHEHVDNAVIMRRIEQEAARMKTLVEDLLLLARLDETRPVETALVDVAVLGADACSDAVAADPTRAVSLDAPAPLVVRANADHLRQAIANLVTNAIKHTPTGTPIEVSVTAVGDRARLAVRDHGPGLDPEALAHVFERFWQADAARVGTGAGLGLSIVDSIARQCGGSASATNAPGGGAVFSIELPLAAVPSTPSHPDQEGS